MGQKGQFLANRLNYSILWNDFWYNKKFYNTTYNQVKLIKEFIDFFFKVGLLTTVFFTPEYLKKAFKFKNTDSINSYQKKLKINILDLDFTYIKPVRGLYFSNIWVLKLSNSLIVSLFLYKLIISKKINVKNKLLRLIFFYKSFFYLRKSDAYIYNK